MRIRLRRKITKLGVDSRGITTYVRKLHSWERRKGRGLWRRAQCRLETTEWDDPIMEMSGCSGEFANDFRKKDLRDGCPSCTGMVADNASEPDVMARWELGPRRY